MLPEQFLDRMKQMLGEEFPAFLESYEQEKYQALRINPQKTRIFIKFLFFALAMG